ncbi:MAG: hypothetical protein A3C44_01680 [Gammaproteobacteria bacterium RIFCSPHIGHO2_02_FULL_39_13]|nr:MAG: hypothetical protein A3C44_01680 [Gammaproteobacteria bacterium RIFCSPHIGHO2_02_FULL_39_13]OGT49593.1 MAG: hypothetical protein A3E53_00425 [Gammaproteobacteria bacterium RIFCSPHIGHO2_12_FULL_39_24]
MACDGDLTPDEIEAAQLFTCRLFRKKLDDPQIVNKIKAETRKQTLFTASKVATTTSANVLFPRKMPHWADMTDSDSDKLCGGTPPISKR